MRTINTYLITIWLLFTGMTMVQISCKKFLDEKPQKILAVPKTLADLQTLLDNHFMMNERSSALAEMAADNYFVPFSSWQTRSPDDRMNYIWDASATYISGWKLPYQGPVYYSNVVLDNLPGIADEEKNNGQFTAIKGAALFYRSFTFHQLAQLYCRPFSTSAASDPGIPLLTTAAIEQTTIRASVQETYDRILTDLKLAAELLPETVSFSSRPNKAAAFGALARVYLSMRAYAKAGQYADSCLKRNPPLMDFNQLVPVGTPPIQRFNRETIFYNHAFLADLLDNEKANIDTTLYQSYAEGDLRKIVFFKPASGGYVSFQGSYDGSYIPYIPFDGITTAEILLIRAECLARNGSVEAALADLNTLLKKRWKDDGSFIPVTATDPEDARKKILTERRKELVYKNLRWSDLRRFNLEGANITLTRILNGITYSLPPNEPRWVMLIPHEVIKFGGMPQNPR